MILIVKSKKYKDIIRKVLSFSALIIMFTLYYNHMSDQFKEQNIKLEEELKKILREEAHNIKIESEKVIDPELYEDYLEYNVDDLEILKGI